MKKNIVILGSTGSIGTQTLNVITNLQTSNQDYFHIVALSCGSNIDLLAQQANRFHPEIIAVKGKKEREKIKSKIDKGIEIKTGSEGLKQLASFDEADLVVNALVGFIGLEPTLQAVENEKTLLLANKESLVVGGRLVDEKLKDLKSEIIPIDSEHNAIFQALETGKTEEVEKLVLTASGGPFLSTRLEDIPKAGPQEALDHPNWEMGDRITCDSASMVNKALEVIEAHWLFGLPYEQIQAVIHPQSVVHSLVQFRDGSIIGELGEPDMRVPIQYALTYPHRRKNNYNRTNLIEVGNLEFRNLEEERYPAFKVVLQAGKKGGNRPAAVNGADEALIKNFLSKRIKFGDLVRGIELVLDRLKVVENPTLEELKSTDQWAREKVDQMIQDGTIGER